MHVKESHHTKTSNSGIVVGNFYPLTVKHCLIRVYGFGGLERWNGMVEWTGLDWTGMEWNGTEGLIITHCSVRV